MMNRMFPCRIHFRGREPVRRRCRQHIEYLEHHRAGSPRPDQRRRPVPGSIARPYTYSVGRRDTYSPRVPVTVARSSLPCDFLYGTDYVPVDFIRPVHLLQGIQCIEYGYNVFGLTCHIRPCHVSIGSRNLIQPAFSAAKNQRQSVIGSGTVE